MRLERLEVRHFTSLDHVVLDLTTVPSGLVAITGPNGAGKTTLLESVVAALYRTLPSRGGELVDYATDKDSTIDVRLALDGIGAFHARVNVDAIRRTSDAVLEHQDVPVSDGKVSTFDQKVREYFPSLPVLLASAVAAQNKRGNFIGKKPKERKELFADLLALNHLEAMSQTAKLALGTIDEHRTRLLAVRAELARVTDPAVAIQHEQRSRQLQTERVAAQRDRDAYTTRARDLDAHLETLQAAVTAHATATDRAKRLDADLAVCQADRKRLTEHHRAAVAAVERKFTAAVRDLDTKIANNQKLQGRADAIRGAVATLETLIQKDWALRETLDQRTGRLQATTERHHAQEHRLELLQRTDLELQQAEQGEELIQSVPFGASCAEAGCRFVRDATVALSKVPDLRRAVADKPQVQASVAELSAAIADHKQAISALSVQLGAIATERTEHQTLAALGEKLAATEARIAELQTMRQTTLDDQVERIAELQTEREREQAALDARLEALTAERATVDEALTQTAHGHRQAQRVQEDLSGVRGELEAVAGRLAALAVEDATLVQTQQAYGAAVMRHTAVQHSLGALDSERVIWQQLHKALSRDGVPVLEMDAAGPRISELTNTLLMACFGSRFSVELVTQQAKASGAGMKESFELLVTDNERGGEPREVGDLSGGEQVIVSEALMNAISIFVNERSGLPIRTCWRDETTGALDPENTARYLQMLRQVLTLGDYHHIFFITQSPAVAAQADAQIRVSDGTAVIAFPPYEEAA